MLTAEKHHASPPTNVVGHDKEPLDFSTFVEGFVGDIKGYVNAQRHYLMLQASHKSAVLLAKAVQHVALLSGIAFAGLFLGVSLALYVGDLLASYPLGFLITAALALIGRRPSSVRVLDFATLYRDAFGFDPHSADIETLRDALGEVTVNADGLGRDDWLDLLMTHRLQPAFAADAITVVHDWPASQCALARIRPGIPPVAERFELYLGPLELANGYHELTNAAEQRARFESDLARRSARGLPLPPIDQALLDALPALPACAGVALGVERLLMALCGTTRISDVLVYDFGCA